MKQFYTAKDLIKLLGFSKNTIYKYLEEGKIKSTRVGKRGGYRVPVEEVEKLMQLHGKKSVEEGVVSEKAEERDERKERVPLKQRIEEAPERMSFINRMKLEMTELAETDHSPNLFDWFMGLASIAVGFSLFLQPAFMYRNAFAALLPVFGLMRYFMMAAGLLFLLTDILRLKDGILHKFMHVLVGVGFGLFGTMMWIGGIISAGVLYLSISFVLFVTAAFRGIKPVYRFIWLVFLATASQGVASLAMGDAYLRTVNVPEILVLSGVWIVCPLSALASLPPPPLPTSIPPIKLKLLQK